MLNLVTSRLIHCTIIWFIIYCFPVVCYAQVTGNTSPTQVQIQVFLEALLPQLEGCRTCLFPDMVIVSTGTFMMGSPEDEPNIFKNEGPQHLVTLSKPFAVGKFEVTRKQFRAFIDETGYDAGSFWINPAGSFADNPAPLNIPLTDVHPVTHVSWEDAQAYVRWLTKRVGIIDNEYDYTTATGFRLLSEAEWEYVARAGTTTAYNFGDTIDTSLANYSYDGRFFVIDFQVVGGTTAAVGSYRANAFGLYDVHGNAFEWVEDCWHGDYNGAPTDGSAWVDDCDNNRRVLRGGSWRNASRSSRSANRSNREASDRDSSERRAPGFRVARTLP